MASLLVPLAEGFEEIEAIAVVDVLRRAGMEVVMASVSDSRRVAGGQGVVVEADALLEDVMEKSFDMLILPGGGKGVAVLKKSPTVKKLLTMYKSKPYAAICAAPSVLAAESMLTGKKATSYPSAESEVVQGGAHYSVSSVVIDGSTITSRGAGTAIEFALSIIEFFDGREKSDEIAEKIVYTRLKA